MVVEQGEIGESNTVFCVSAFMRTCFCIETKEDLMYVKRGYWERVKHIYFYLLTSIPTLVM
jgi:hypothetical protein